MKICSFGEILLRYALPSQQQWLYGATINAYLGGAEMNVAVALANWGQNVKYCTAMPQHFMAEQILANLTAAQIDCSAIQRFGDKIGVYYVPEGEDVKNAGVFYDRANSAFSQLKVGQIDWETVLSDCDWFHFSAIVPTLNSDLEAVCHEALEVAVQKGLTISFDLNYRAKLWENRPLPPTVIQPFLKYCDVLMGNVWSANILLGSPLSDTTKDRFHKENCLNEAQHIAQLLFNQNAKLKYIANTYRFSETDLLHYYATFHDRKSNFCSKTFETNSIIDKVGSGDCFMAGLIYGLRQNMETQAIIDFAAAAAYGKLQEKGDCSRQSLAQIKNLL